MAPSITKGSPTLVEHHSKHLHVWWLAKCTLAWADVTKGGTTRGDALHMRLHLFVGWPIVSSVRVDITKGSTTQRSVAHAFPCLVAGKMYINRECTLRA
jgi:hypothetical protein